MAKPTPPDEKRCTAKSKQSGERCKRHRQRGHFVCYYHGAAAPAAKAKVERERVEAEISAVVERLDIVPVDNPLLELQKLAGEVIAWKEVIKGQVLKLEQLRYSGEYGEQIRAEVQLFERALDRCASVLGLIAKLNIDARLAAIEEAKIVLVVEAVEAGLAAVGMPVDVQMKATAEVGRRLRSAG